MSTLTERILQGDARATARGISLIENDPDAGASLVRELYGKSGRALVVGVTGAPGVGKSTVVDGLVRCWRTAGKVVGVIAVDPSSPYSGGAMLGDRVRMQAHAGDAGVFIRSMATRGHLGGLARATADTAVLLDAAGKQVVMIETIGVGQDEVDIVRTADVAVLVLAPGMGDEVQALKAGVMEIADIFVVNKSDREGADRAVADVESLLSLQTYDEEDWKPPVIRTTATTAAGLEDLAAAIERFSGRAAPALAARRRERASAQVRLILIERTMKRVDERIDPAVLEQIIDRVSRHDTDPYTAADVLLRQWEQGAP